MILDYPDWWEKDDEFHWWFLLTDAELENFDWEDNG